MPKYVSKLFLTTLSPSLPHFICIQLCAAQVPHYCLSDKDRPDREDILNHFHEEEKRGHDDHMFTCHLMIRLKPGKKGMSPVVLSL